MVGKAYKEKSLTRLKFNTVEHLTVNQRVVGSSPTGGAYKVKKVILL